MPTYTTKFDTPEPIRSFIQCINGIAHLRILNETSVTVEFESTDEYELANTVREFQDELNTLLGYNYVTIERPLPIASAVTDEVSDITAAERAKKREKIKANKCKVCGTSALKCEQTVFGKSAKACCVECGRTDTHDMDLDDWRAFREQNADAIGRIKRKTGPRQAKSAATTPGPRHFRHRWGQGIGKPSVRECVVKGCEAIQVLEGGKWK